MNINRAIKRVMEGIDPKRVLREESIADEVTWDVDVSIASKSTHTRDFLDSLAGSLQGPDVRDVGDTEGVAKLVRAVIGDLDFKADRYKIGDQVVLTVKLYNNEVEDGTTYVWKTTVGWVRSIARGRKQDSDIVSHFTSNTTITYREKEDVWDYPAGWMGFYRYSSGSGIISFDTPDIRSFDSPGVEIWARELASEFKSESSNKSISDSTELTVELINIARRNTTLLASITAGDLRSIVSGSLSKDDIVDLLKSSFTVVRTSEDTKKLLDKYIPMNYEV